MSTNELKTSIETLVVNQYLASLDNEELSLCEKLAKFTNRIDKTMKPFAKSRFRIEIDSSEQQPELEYLMQKIQEI
ncbi:MAG: hypothetical protein GY861_14425, partial [bacterium]|nr:hypothetical protein [bacterium]